MLLTNIGSSLKWGAVFDPAACELVVATDDPLNYLTSFLLNRLQFLIQNFDPDAKRVEFEDLKKRSAQWHTLAYFLDFFLTTLHWAWDCASKFSNSLFPWTQRRWLAGACPEVNWTSLESNIQTLQAFIQSCPSRTLKRCIQRRYCKCSSPDLGLIVRKWNLFAGKSAGGIAPNNDLQKYRREIYGHSVARKGLLVFWRRP